MLEKNSSADRIFISYRRDDTQGYAGRLEDSLAAYFGPDRVFRDVGGIKGGVDFAHAVEKELAGAGAVIVLIGQHWLTAARDRHARTDDSTDYVSLEVTTALQKGIAVVPVLVEHASMPREEDLPEALRALARRNAVSISDERWSADVIRLAKVLAIDVPGSVAELTLNRLRIAIVALLLVAFVLPIAAFSLAAYSSATGTEPFKVTEDIYQIFVASAFSWAIPSASFVAILTACALLMLAAKHIDRAKVKFIYGSIWTGALGALGSFVFYGVVRNPGDIIGIFASSTMTIAVMLAFMTLSGFKSA